jgi:hypothetical protein
MSVFSLIFANYPGFRLCREIYFPTNSDNQQSIAHRSPLVFNVHHNNEYLEIQRCSNASTAWKSVCLDNTVLSPTITCPTVSDISILNLKQVRVRCDYFEYWKLWELRTTTLRTGHSVCRCGWGTLRSHCFSTRVLCSTRHCTSG